MKDFIREMWENSEEWDFFRFIHLWGVASVVSCIVIGSLYKPAEFFGGLCWGLTISLWLTTERIKERIKAKEKAPEGD